MEEEWVKYLRENAPELYKEMLSSTEWANKWRDERIATLEKQLTEHRGARYLEGEIQKAIDYCRHEFDMSYVEAIGTLYIAIQGLCEELNDES